MKLSKLKSDSARAEGGVWIDNIPGCEDLRLRVRAWRCNTDRRVEARELAAMTPDQRRAFYERDFDLVEQVKVTRMRDAILLEWENLEDAPYSPELAAEMLDDPDCQLLREAIDYAASSVQSSSDADTKESVGNSLPPSSGRSSGARSSKT